MDLHTQDDDVDRRITTERLLLRPLTRADLEDVVTLVGDYEVSKMLVPVPYPYSDEDAEDFLAMDAEGALDLLWMIEFEDRLAGAISIGVELGYWLGQPFWGKGIMTEAGIAAISAYFAGRRTDLIRSSHFVENAASAHVLRKLCFRDVGAHLHHSKARGADVPGRSMILRRHWFEAKHGS